MERVKETRELGGPFFARKISVCAHFLGAGGASSGASATPALTINHFLTWTYATTGRLDRLFRRPPRPEWAADCASQAMPAHFLDFAWVARGGVMGMGRRRPGAAAERPPSSTFTSKPAGPATADGGTQQARRRAQGVPSAFKTRRSTVGVRSSRSSMFICSHHPPCERPLRKENARERLRRAAIAL